MSVKARKMFRFKTLTLTDVFSVMDNGDNFMEIDGVIYSLKSQRLRLFHDSGITCVTCGLEGKYFVLETASMKDKAHLNLYGIGEDSAEILFTKDHIVPKSKGGPNRMENYQTMCTICNFAKGNALEE